MLSQLHTNELQRIADYLSDTEDPWWVLGSAAMALIEIDPGDIRDIDVLVSERDADALIRKHSLTNMADGGTDGFRSNFFLTPNLGQVPVEIMAGYQIRTAGAWQVVEPKTRLRIPVGSAAIFVPDRDEQMHFLKRLGRPKDRDRLQRFQA